MPQVHPTAILQGDVELGEGVVVGPHCVLTGPIEIGAGTRLIGSAYCTGPLVLGRDNVVYPFSCLGFAPQDLKWDRARPGAGLVLGDGNTIREHVTIHRATSDDRPTTVGDRNYFMASSHAGHDCRIADDCIFANGTLLAGFVEIGPRVITGGAALVHQFCRVGRGAMLSGAMGMGRDLPPFFTLTGHNIAGSINMIGLRRSGMAEDEIQDVRWVFKTLYRRGLAPRAALEALRERAERPLVAEYLAFLESAERGYCPGFGNARRGSA